MCVREVKGVSPHGFHLHLLAPFSNTLPSQPSPPVLWLPVHASLQPFASLSSAALARAGRSPASPADSNTYKHTHTHTHAHTDYIYPLLATAQLQHSLFPSLPSSLTPPCPNLPCNAAISFRLARSWLFTLSFSSSTSLSRSSRRSRWSLRRAASLDLTCPSCEAAPEEAPALPPAP